MNIVCLLKLRRDELLLRFRVNPPHYRSLRPCPGEFLLANKYSPFFSSSDCRYYAESIIFFVCVFVFFSPLSSFDMASRMLQARCWTAGPSCPVKRRSLPCSSFYASERPSPSWSSWQSRRRKAKRSRCPHQRPTLASGLLSKATTALAALAFLHTWKIAAHPVSIILKTSQTAWLFCCPSSTSIQSLRPCWGCPQMG